MSSDEEPVDQDTARRIVAELPSDPHALTDEQIERLGELVLSENHGVVSIVGEFVKELAREDASTLRPILPELLSVLTHTDKIRRGDYVATLSEFDREPLNRHDPVDDWYGVVIDEDAEVIERVKAAGAIGAFATVRPDSVRTVTPDCLDYFADHPIEHKQLASAIGNALGRIAAADEVVRGDVTMRFERMIEDGTSLSRPKLAGVLSGIEYLVEYESNTLDRTLDRIIELAGDRQLDDEGQVLRSSIIRTIQRFAEVDIELVRPHVPELAALLTDENRFVRQQVAKLFAEVGEADPSFVEPAIDDLVGACTDEEADVRNAALDALSPFEDEQAAGAEQAIPLFVEEVVDISEDGYANRDRDAARGLSICAEKFPEKVIPVLPEIVPAFASPSSGIRSGIANTVGELGRQRPDAVRYTVDPEVAGETTPASAVPLVEAIDDDRESVRSSAAGALGDLTVGDPSLFELTRAPLVEQALEDGNWMVEHVAVRALGRIGKADPDAVRDLVPALIERLGDENASLRAAACEALGKIGARDPGAVGAAEQPLVDCLDDHVVRVRAAACEAVAQLGIERTGPKLRQLADDPEDQIRTAAADALETLGLPEDGPVSTDDDETRHTESIDDIENRTEGDGSEPDDGGVMASETIDRTPEPADVSTPPSLELDYEAFERQELLGRGGTAEVYRATVETDDGPVDVAVKEPNFDGTMTKETFERFRTEVDVWQRIDDRTGVVDVVGWGEQPLPWIAMEYMDGGTLAERIGEVGIDEALWICGRIAHTVRHDRTGVQHLDLKPSNVLFRETPEGKWDLPKVADWGLARMIAETSASSDGFTVTYAAPEQFNPDDYGTTDSRTDIYQLGALTYELLAGEPPFTGPNHAVMHGVLNEQPEPVSSRDPALPSALDEVVGRALRKEKSDRYETVERFHAALREVRQRE